MAGAVKSRKEQAARTRLAILRAATEEFAARGYFATTMAAIAERAGVAVQTVYFAFRTKPALLTAAIENAVLGEDEPTPPHLTAWHREATTTTDGRRAIEAFVGGTLAITQRAAKLNRVMQAASDTDEDVAAVRDHHERLRVKGFRGYVDTLEDRGLLAPGMDAVQATDIVLTLCGGDVFLGFVEDRGWSVDRFGAWLTNTLCQVLL